MWQLRRNAAFLLTVGSLLLTVELFCLQLSVGAVLLTVVSWSVCLQLELFTYTCSFLLTVEAFLLTLVSTYTDCSKQESSNCE